MAEEFEKPVEKINDEKGERLSLEVRNPFQIEVFNKLIVDGLLDAKDPDSIRKYSKVIRNYIDNSENARVRELILNREFKEAAEIMVIEIERDELSQQAA